ncbi:hypothetical protein cand_037080 [Cryptosporidium andersoni]|uniref:Uncharacterized protein n=1 Tax=Cryptosporidium andersoni TaxID=117008 RepID=A0A1J4MYB4_9CRYT|nr:hypothetical protein cand_037080 [Cryptosporidium andersoni]
MSAKSLFTYININLYLVLKRSFRRFFGSKELQAILNHFYNIKETLSENILINFILYIYFTLVVLSLANFSIATVLWNGLFRYLGISSFFCFRIAAIISIPLVTLFFLPEFYIALPDAFSGFFRNINTKCSALTQISNGPMEIPMIPENWWHSGNLHSVFKGVDIINKIREDPVSPNGIFVTSLINDYTLQDKSVWDKKAFLNNFCLLLINYKKFSTISIYTRVTLALVSIFFLAFLLFSEKREKQYHNMSPKLPIYVYRYLLSRAAATYLLYFTQDYYEMDYLSNFLPFVLYFISKLTLYHCKILQIILEHLVWSRDVSKLKSNSQELLKKSEKISQESLEENSSKKLGARSLRAQKVNLILRSVRNKTTIGNQNKKQKEFIKLASIMSLKPNTNNAPKNKIFHLFIKIFRVTLHYSQMMTLFNVSVKFFKRSSLILYNIIKILIFDPLESLFWYFYERQYRGLILDALSHHNLDEFLRRKKVSLNILEELLKSMTLCYSNVGSITVIRSITISRANLLHELKWVMKVFPNERQFRKLKENCNRNLSDIEKKLLPFADIPSIHNRIYMEIQYYILDLSIESLLTYCEKIILACKALNNSESLIELLSLLNKEKLSEYNIFHEKLRSSDINKITNNLFNLAKRKGSANVWEQYSTISGILLKTEKELKGVLQPIEYIEPNLIFKQWEMVKLSLKSIKNEITQNRNSYEDMYMNGFSLHTVQMVLHHQNYAAVGASEKIQECISECIELCRNCGTIIEEETDKFQRSSEAQLKILSDTKSYCIGILRLLDNMLVAMQSVNICTVNMESSTIKCEFPTLQAHHPKVTTNKLESLCKLHGKGLRQTFTTYSDGNYPPNTSLSNNITRSTPERISDDSKDTLGTKQGGLTKRRDIFSPCTINKSDVKRSLKKSMIPLISDNTVKLDNDTDKEYLPFLISTPDEVVREII